MTHRRGKLDSQAEPFGKDLQDAMFGIFLIAPDRDDVEFSVPVEWAEVVENEAPLAGFGAKGEVAKELEKVGKPCADELGEDDVLSAVCRARSV